MMDMVQIMASRKPRIIKKSSVIAQKALSKKCARQYSMNRDASIDPHKEIREFIDMEKDLAEVVKVSFIRNRAVMTDLSKY